MITDFSTSEASEIVEVFIPWTGAGRAVPKVISETAIAAIEAITHPYPNWPFVSPSDPSKKPERACYARIERDNRRCPNAASIICCLWPGTKLITNDAPYIRAS